MKTSQRGIDLIKEFEGFVGYAYKALPSEECYTIGYGHCSPSVKETDTISREDAEKLLADDLAYYELSVDLYKDKYHWTQSEYDALVSFAYNVGNIRQLTQYGTRSKAEIADAMLLYVHDGNGNTIEGLVRRRERERDMFLDNIPLCEKYTESSTIDDIVDGVMDGEFGNDEDRKNNIYNLIQTFVNRRFS